MAESYSENNNTTDYPLIGGVKSPVGYPPTPKTVEAQYYTDEINRLNAQIAQLTDANEHLQTVLGYREAQLQQYFELLKAAVSK